MRYSSYYLYRKYEQRDGQDVLPVVPTTYSFDGDGTMPKVLHRADDPSCSEIPVIYRWVDMDISTDYWCDECSGSVTTYKARGNRYSSSGTYSIPCNDSSILDYDEFSSNWVGTLIVGSCVTEISSGLSRLNIDSGISIPYSVTIIGDYAFANNNRMDFCIIENGLRTIGDYAFSGCTELLNLELPDSIEEIGSYAFSNCMNLRQIHIPTGLTEISEGCFNHCIGILDITIPSGVTSIGANAFSGCSSLAEVTIPSTVTSIGNHAFGICRQLSDIIIPSSVINIDNHTFSVCDNLISVIFSNNSQLESIGEYVFSYCSRLSGITIPSGVTSIGQGAFDGCYMAVSNFINNSNLDEVANNYWGCNIVDSEINGLLIKNNSVVKYRKHSSSFVVIPNSVTSIGNQAFYNTSIISIDIPNSVTSIGNSAFTQCIGLTSVTIPNSVTTIGYGAFSGCSGLTNIEIQGEIIGDKAFSWCTGATACTIGSGVTSIGQYSFQYCSSLTRMVVEATTPPTLGWNAFEFASDFPIYVPSGSVETYKSASGWSYYASRIQAIP